MTSDRANLRALLAEAVKGPLHTDPAEGTIMDASGRQVACLLSGATRRATAELFALAPTVILAMLADDDAANEEEKRLLGLLHAASERAQMEAARRVIAEAERDEARALIAGRTERPSDADVAAHVRTGGSWRWVVCQNGIPVQGLCGETEWPPADVLAGLTRRAICVYTELWWALDARRCITTWPKVAAKILAMKGPDDGND